SLANSLNCAFDFQTDECVVWPGSPDGSSNIAEPVEVFVLRQPARNDGHGAALHDMQKLCGVIRLGGGNDDRQDDVVAAATSTPGNAAVIFALEVAVALNLQLSVVLRSAPRA